MNPKLTCLCFWLLLFGIAFAGELVIGTIGWILPLVSAVFFCFALQCSWQRAAFAAVLAGMLLDLETGRSFPVSILALWAMLPALYQGRPAELTVPVDLFGTAAAASASVEAVYALAARGSLMQMLLQWSVLTVQDTILTLIVLWLVYCWTDALKIPNGFTPRSALWKKNRRNMKRNQE